MSVYDPVNFTGRVNYAAACIASESNSTRAFDTCFEMNDGNAVAVALYRRATARPAGRLANNLWRYLSRESVELLSLKNAGRDLNEWARNTRETAKAENAGFWAYHEDCKRCPNYHDGTKRPLWGSLPDYVRQTWIRNPTQRFPECEATK